MATTAQPGFEAHPFRPPIVPRKSPRQRQITGVPSLPQQFPIAQEKSTAKIVSWKIPAIVATIVFGGTLMVWIFNSVISDSKYEMNTSLEDGELFSKINVNVKGSAKNLAVVITDPFGETESLQIRKDELLSGNKTVNFSVSNFEEGTYKIALVLLDSKIVVSRMEMPIFLKKVWVERVEVITGKNPFGSADNQNLIMGLKVSIKKDGNLPTRFNIANIFVNDKKIILPLVKNVYDGKSQLVQIEMPGGYSLKGFNPGDKCLIRGTLFYGETKNIDFEKEFTIGSNTE